jgi:hypothetical protein
MNRITVKFKSILLFFVLFPFFSFAQIQGSVRDTENKPVSFANVQLLHQRDSTAISGIMATEEGTFNFTTFQPGKYIIGVSMIGYKTGFSKPFTMNSSKDHFHADPIVVEEDTHELQEVNVVAKKPVYELQIDRMVVNVENSITSTGNTALEVLEKSPGIIVDRQNNSISMGGKSGVMVMINGKQNRMPIEAAVQMLSSMSSDNIKKIELITTPPSKYDAEGDAGIINIVMKKNESFGTNGSFTLGAGVSKREKMEGSFNLNHHVDKVNYYGSYNANFNNTRQNIQSFRRFNQEGSVMETDADSKREAIVMFQNIRMGMDYTISSKTVVSFLGTGYVRDWDSDALNEVLYLKNQVKNRSSNLQMTEMSKWIHGMGNLNLKHNFKEDEYIDLNFDYLNYYNDNPSDYTVENLNASGQLTAGEDIKVGKVTPIDIFVGMADYSKQINKKIKWETGIKGTLTGFTNDVGVSYFRDGRWTPDMELTNKYSLAENISAAYTTFSFNFNEKTSMVAGLRYEYMNSVLDSETEKGIVDLHYGELFPTLYFSRKLNKNNTVQLAYNRRIDRPTFNELAPFIVFLTPETFVAGNENLVPAFSNILKADYQFKTIMLSVSYTDTKNSISRFQPKFNSDETKQYFISRNLDKTTLTSITLAFPVKMTEWWRMQNNFNWISRTLATNYEDTYIDVSHDNYRINSIQSIKLGKKVSAEVSGYYQSRSLNGVYISKPVGKVDVGLQVKFKNENSKLNLNYIDVFKTNIFRSVADVPELNIYNRWSLDFEPRVLRLTFTHNFGSTAIKMRKRNTASDEEQRRVGN